MSRFRISGDQQHCGIGCLSGTGTELFPQWYGCKTFFLSDPDSDPTRRVIKDTDPTSQVVSDPDPTFLLKDRTYFVENVVVITAFLFQESFFSMIISDPGPVWSFWIPILQVRSLRIRIWILLGEKFRIRAGPDPQHCFSKFVMGLDFFVHHRTGT